MQGAARAATTLEGDVQDVAEQLDMLADDIADLAPQFKAVLDSWGPICRQLRCTLMGAAGVTAGVAQQQLQELQPACQGFDTVVKELQQAVAAAESAAEQLPAPNSGRVAAFEQATQKLQSARGRVVAWLNPA
jgi:ElaB/YqjD/DUF883 family membrane-anchored ribosome-binding protein